MLSRRVIQLMSCNDMAGIESLYFQLSEEISSKSNMEWKFPTGGNIYDTMAECLLPDDVPQSLRAIITTGNGDCLYNAVSLAISQLLLFVYILTRGAGIYLSQHATQQTTRVNEKHTTSLSLKKIISASTKYFFLVVLVNFVCSPFVRFIRFL